MADDESVKMATLKKAYAEIILNTSKEAAARIMVADRKALRFEKDLLNLKQDALRMLVQLKQVLDSKTAEAEVESASQQRKIDELEAQLSEAEGIIVDLREELRLTQDKLDRVKYIQQQPLKRHNSEDCENQKSPHESESIDRVDDRRCIAARYPSTGNACNTENPSGNALRCVDSDQPIRCAQEQPSTPFHPCMLSNCNASLRKFDDVKSSRERCSSCSSESEEKEAKITSNGSEAKSMDYEGRYSQALRDNFRRTRKNVKYREAIAALRRSSRGRRAKSCQPSSFPQHRTYSAKRTKTSVKVPENIAICPAPESYIVTSSHEQNHDHEIARDLLDKSRFRETDVDHPEKESDLSCYVDPSRRATSLGDGNLHDVKISEVIHNRVDGEKVLKFTFQRKRKKEALTKVDDGVITPKEGGITTSRALGEQGDGVKLLQKSIVKDEQSKDSSQLLQIAQQLISLSGNGR